MIATPTSVIGTAQKHNSQKTLTPFDYVLFKGGEANCRAHSEENPCAILFQDSGIPSNTIIKKCNQLMYVIVKKYGIYK